MTIERESQDRGPETVPSAGAPGAGTAGTEQPRHTLTQPAGTGTQYPQNESWSEYSIGPDGARSYRRSPGPGPEDPGPGWIPVPTDWSRHSVPGTAGPQYPVPGTAGPQYPVPGTAGPQYPVPGPQGPGTPVSGTGSPAGTKKNPWWVPWVDHGTMWPTSAIVGWFAGMGQYQFAHMIDIGNPWAYLATGLFEAVMIGFLIRGYLRARDNLSPALWWFVATLIGVVSIGVQIMHSVNTEQATFYAAASAFVLLLWFGKLYDSYRKVLRTGGRAISPIPKYGRVWFLMPRLAWRGMLIGTATQSDAIEETLRMAWVWIATYRTAKLAGVRRDIRKITAWNSVYEMAGLTTITLPKHLEVQTVGLVELDAGPGTGDPGPIRVQSHVEDRRQPVPAVLAETVPSPEDRVPPVPGPTGPGSPVPGPVPSPEDRVPGTGRSPSLDGTGSPVPGTGDRQDRGTRYRDSGPVPPGPESPVPSPESRAPSARRVLGPGSGPVPTAGGTDVRDRTGTVRPGPKAPVPVSPGPVGPRNLGWTPGPEQLLEIVAVVDGLAERLKAAGEFSERDWPFFRNDVLSIAVKTNKGNPDLRDLPGKAGDWSGGDWLTRDRCVTKDEAAELTGRGTSNALKIRRVVEAMRNAHVAN